MNKQRWIILGVIAGLIIGLYIFLNVWSQHPCDRYNAMAENHLFVECCVETVCGLDVKLDTDRELTEEEFECIATCFDRGIERVLDQARSIKSTLEENGWEFVK